MAVTPSVPFVPASVSQPTDSARRDNQMREAIVQVSQTEAFARERGIGGESERAPKPGLASYAKQLADARVEAEGIRRRADREPTEDDNTDASSEGESEQERREAQAEERELRELRQRDQEVRRHEEAHANVGGQYAGTPQYEYERGPDGRNYAVGGEVEIDVSPIPGDAAATLRKMQTVQRAALAPEEPSPADRRIANEASRKEAEARREIAEERAEEMRERNIDLDGLDNDDETMARMIERGTRIEAFYQGSFRPRETAVLAQA
ncbi:MAG: catalase [Idiomarina sp.]|nr:catalase [Idiomarina sp.]